MNMVDTFDHLVNVAQVCRKCPTITLRRAYVRALRDWYKQTQWLRTAVSGATVADSRQYSLGNDPYLDVIGVFAMQGSQSQSQGIQYWPIVPSDSGQWDPNMNPGMPVRYQDLAEAQFAVDPLPNDAYDLLITMIVQPKEATEQIPEAPLLKYSNTIEAGALAYLLAVPGQPWSDRQEAVKQANVFRSGVSNGKAEAQRNFNVGSQRIRPRQFLV